MEPDDNATEDSHQQQLLAAFARWSRTYELILHSASEGIFSLDTDGRITFANPAASRLLGWPVEDMLTRPAAALLYGDSPNPLAGETEFQHRRQVFLQRDGSSIVVECNQALILEDGQTVGAVLMFNDISERERAEQTLQETLSSLEQTNRRLTQTHDQLLHAEKLAAIGQLAAGVAHEINTPLGYVQSNLGAMARHLEDLLTLVDGYESASAAGRQPLARERIDLEFLRQDAPQVLAETRQGISRVSTVVRHLLEFSSTCTSGEWRQSDLEAICRTAAERACQKRHNFRLEQRYDAMPPLHCLPERLQQALENLIDNALLAIPAEGMVRLHGSCIDGRQVSLTVEDNGCGIAPKHLESIFNPFFTTRPVGSGEGMGLSVADTVARLHGGNIKVESRPGLGSRFTLNLPLEQSLQQGKSGPP